VGCREEMQSSKVIVALSRFDCRSVVSLPQTVDYYEQDDVMNVILQPTGYGTQMFCLTCSPGSKILRKDGTYQTMTCDIGGRF